MTFKVRNAGNRAGEVYIYDEIAPAGFGISAKQFIDEVQALGPVDTLSLRLNTIGGDVFEGIAIYNFLKRQQARVVVDVDGEALSIGSIIAMAGREIRMARNARMMIHDPWTVAGGTAEDFRKRADIMDQAKDSLVQMYMQRTGRDAAEIATMMSEETWMSAEDAVELGFADSITEPLQIAAKFDLSRFRKPPRTQATSQQPSIGANVYRAKLAEMTKRAKACGAIRPQ